jgi:hypothetical protein
MSAIKIDKNAKVFVAAPAGSGSGGPELLHQMVNKLRAMGVQAYIYYYWFKPNVDPVHIDFKAYDNPYVLEVSDESGNILVVPETQTAFLQSYSQIRKVIWWLSVDFYYASMGFDMAYHRRLANRFIRSLILIGKSKKKRDYFYFNEKGDQKIFHFVQSEYARLHLMGKGIAAGRIHYLSDYLNGGFISGQLSSDVKSQDIVAYNPKKGYEYTKKIIAAAPDIEFIPIVDMSRAQVVELLTRAKVYIDFGNHPGKDRIPREAAISGACVITNNQGAAAFQQDLPILDEYKFEQSEAAIEDVIIKIRNCFANFDREIRNFATYRERIASEEIRFEQDLASLFSLQSG